MNKAFELVNLFLALAVGSLLVTVFVVTQPSGWNYGGALVFVVLAWVCWWVARIAQRKSQNDSPIPFESGEKPEFILWRDGIYQRTVEQVDRE